jgi:hypothetical protein
MTFFDFRPISHTQRAALTILYGGNANKLRLAISRKIVHGVWARGLKSLRRVLGTRSKNKHATLSVPIHRH